MDLIGPFEDFLLPAGLNVLDFDYSFRVPNVSDVSVEWTDDRAFLPTIITYLITFFLGIIGMVHNYIRSILLLFLFKHILGGHTSSGRTVGQGACSTFTDLLVYYNNRRVVGYRLIILNWFKTCEVLALGSQDWSDKEIYSIQ